MGDRDRISELPDGLIHRILSRIDMPQVVRTCILSKRWRYIWTSVNTIRINFNSPEFQKYPSKERIPRFIDSVDKVLNLRDAVADVNKFRLAFYKQRDDGNLECRKYSRIITSRLNAWMSYVGRRNIKHLSIFIDMLAKMTFELPECLLNCKTLVKLKLIMGGQHYSLVVVPKSFCLPRLRSLFLEGLSFENPGAATRLISSCPILKFLDISFTSVEMDNHQDFTIDSSTLENLIMQKGGWQDRPMGKIIKLNAPNLTSFSCTDNMTQEYSLRNLPSLVDAEIEMLIEIKDNLGIMEYPELYLELSEENKEKYGKHLLNLLGALRNVKNLTVPSEGILEVVSGALDMGTQLPQCCNLQCLSLNFWFTRRCLRSVVHLLTISPNIESLRLDMISFKDYPLPPQLGIPDNVGGSHRFNFLVKVGDDWKAGLPLPFTLLHLKNVFIDDVEGQDNELEFLEFLLKTAVVLEEMCLRCYVGDASPDRTRQIDRYCEKLRTLPGASSSLTIKFENLCPSRKPVRPHQ